MINTILRGKPDAGNPHVRFDAEEVASAQPRRGPLLYNLLAGIVLGLIACSGKADVVRIGAENGYVPLDYKAKIVRGSVLDLSSLVPDEPCGTYGRVVVRNGHFEFEKRPGVALRFHGSNIHADATNRNTPETAKELVDRLVAAGYNSLRLHNIEYGPTGLLADSPDGLTIPPKRFAGMDAVMAACKNRGVYVTLDFYASLSVPWTAIGVDKPGLIGKGKGEKSLGKYVFMTNPKARAILGNYIRQILTHVNPHTGVRYADEPTLMTVSIMNESGFGWTRHGPKGWTLRERAAVEKTFFDEMSAAIRSVGSKVPLTDNCMTFFANMDNVADRYDYVDCHTYIDHPRKPKAGESAFVSDMPNSRVFAEGKSIRPSAFIRYFGKPYTISEYNWCGPCRYRGSSGLLFGAEAALQDWDGIYQYPWAHTLDRALNGGKSAVLGMFPKLEVAGDPLGIAAERATACLFLRGDAQPLKRKISMVVKRAEIADPKMAETPFKKNMEGFDVGWYAQVGMSRETAPAGVEGVYGLGDMTSPRKTFFEKAGLDETSLAGDGQVVFEPTRNAFGVMTPKTCGVTVESGSLTAGILTADCGEKLATVWASAMDGKDLTTSGRILLTHLTEQHNCGEVYESVDMKRLLKDGTLPIMMRAAKARVSLRVSEPGQLVAYALETDGTRRDQVPVEVDGGQAVILCDTARNPKNATFLYEIIRR